MTLLSKINRMLKQANIASITKKKKKKKRKKNKTLKSKTHEKELLNSVGGPFSFDVYMTVRRTFLMIKLPPTIDFKWQKQKINKY